MENESLIMQGTAVKAMGLIEIKGKQYGRVGGHLVVFGDENQTDLAGDWFTAKTYLGPADGDGAECLFHHTLPIKGVNYDRDHRFAPMKTKRDETGIFAETVLDLADDYERAVYGVAMAGKLGWSSGSASHLVRREGDVEAGKITRWPIVEGSLTPTPCEPRARATALKALVDTWEGLFDVPQAVADEIERLRSEVNYQVEARWNAEERTALQRRLISLQIEALHLFDVVS